jgi:hypothetical protein
MKQDEKYLNFPIQILGGFMTNSKDTLNNILHYAVYVGTLKLEFGTELEKFKSSAEFFGVSLANPKVSLSNGKMLYESLPTNSPKVGLSVSIFWAYYLDNIADFEKACFIAFLAIKSIIGNKEYCKTVNNFVLARMDGKSNSIIDISELSNEVAFFANRFQISKIISELKSNWGLVYYSRYTRGFYVSFKMDFKDLVLIAEKNRRSTKDKQAKALENDIVKQVLESLK